MAVAAVFAMTAGIAPAAAHSIDAVVLDGKNRPVVNAVVYAYPVNGKAPAREIRPVKVDQMDKEFMPDVTVIQVHTPVYFPNDDTIRHHVYSLSKPKIFEIPLYSGNPANPIIFDNPGVVALGCNIHDWMLAYIYVVDTPYFTKTGSAGKARLEGLEEGNYTVLVWHPDMKGDAKDTAKFLASGGNAPVSFSIKLKANLRVKRAPVAGGGVY